jgi:coenzyme F420 hydrogenase subunit beta
VQSDSGFLRPQQVGAISKESEQTIAAVCPALTLTIRRRREEVHPIWGPIISISQGYADDRALRHHASSGGVLSALLVHLIESRAIDFVVQTAAAEDWPIGNSAAVSTNSGDVFAAAGSRYAPSAPLQDLRAYLQRPGRFAFVGKPCDVAALAELRRRRPEVAEKVPILISFFCAGVPSLHGAREILAKLNAAESDLQSFRYRGDGWPGYATASLKDGTERRMSYADSWGGILSHHVQFRCKICPDGTGGLADIVCADAWHCDDHGYPLFDEQEGYSLIVTRTEKGEALLRGAIAAGRIQVEPVAIEAMSAMQPGQLNRKRLVLSRLVAIALLWQPRPRYRGWRLLDAARQATPLQNLRNFLGMMRRLLARRIAG